MARRYPNGRRRRPGRRPPNRYSGRHGPPQSQGFTPGGFGTFYKLLHAGAAGPREERVLQRDRRLDGRRLRALAGAMIGYSWLGPLGVIFGLGAGIAAGGSTAEKGRFYRR